MASKQPQ